VLVYNLRFPGQYYDAETGLNYNYSRDHDGTGGRYIESDPLGLLAGLSTYSYVKANPIDSVDPVGLLPVGLVPCQPWGAWHSIGCLGSGRRNRIYGPDSIQVAEIKQLPPVRAALVAYRLKNVEEMDKACCSTSKLQPLTGFRWRFNLDRFAEATMDGSCAWHFLGTFAINVNPVDCKTVWI
jgi:RHS repeat-associated protein